MTFLCIFVSVVFQYIIIIILLMHILPMGNQKKLVFKSTMHVYHTSYFVISKHLIEIFYNMAHANAFFLVETRSVMFLLCFRK